LATNYDYRAVVVNSGDNPKGSYYWSHTTSHYQDQNSNSFGSNMNGVSNPIVTAFTPRWPVCMGRSCIDRYLTVAVEMRTAEHVAVVDRYNYMHGYII